MSPLLPLSLLEAMRDHDFPAEVLEDENFQVSLPRRLGLSDVVLLQIRRLEETVRRGDAVPLAEAVDLMRLVLRRQDAPAVLREAGTTIARRHFERRRRPAAGRLGSRGLPRPVVFFAVRRAARRLLRHLLGRGTIELVGRPLAARIRHPFTADLAGDGTACVLFTAVLEELVFLYTGRRERVAHSRCEAQGEGICEWVLES